MRISDWSSDVCSSDLVVPLARPVEGVEAICAEAERQYRIYTDCACEILNIATSGNTVFTERVDRVRLLADDREVVTRVVGIFDMDDDDKIVWWREYWDALDIAGQIGGSGEQMKAIMDTARSEEHTSELQSLMRISHY